MFIELTLYEDSEKILFNLNNINAIYEDDGKTFVCISANKYPYRVKEHYEKVKEAIKGDVSLEG